MQPRPVEGILERSDNLVRVDFTARRKTNEQTPQQQREILVRSLAPRERLRERTLDYLTTRENPSYLHEDMACLVGQRVVPEVEGAWAALKLAEGNYEMAFLHIQLAIEHAQEAGAMFLGANLLAYVAFNEFPAALEPKRRALIRYGVDHIMHSRTDVRTKLLVEGLARYE